MNIFCIFHHFPRAHARLTGTLNTRVIFANERRQSTSLLQEPFTDAALSRWVVDPSQDIDEITITCFTRPIEGAPSKDRENAPMSAKGVRKVPDTVEKFGIPEQMCERLT